MKTIRNSIANAQLAHISKGLGQLFREANDVIFADWHQFHTKGVLVVISVTVCVVSDQFLSVCIP